MDTNPDFKFPINLTGVNAASGGTRNLPDGFFPVKTTACYHKRSRPSDKNPTGIDMIEFKVEVTEGDYTGLVRTLRINVPTKADDVARYFWRAALESHGFTAAQIDQGQVEITAALFIGKGAFLKYVAGDRDAGRYDEANFLSPMDWQRGKAAFVAGAVAVQQATAIMGNASQGGISAMPPAGGLGNVPAAAPVAAPVASSIGGLGVAPVVNGGLGGASAPVSGADLLQSLGAPAA